MLFLMTQMTGYNNQSSSVARASGASDQWLGFTCRTMVQVENDTINMKHVSGHYFLRGVHLGSRGQVTNYLDNSRVS